MSINVANNPTIIYNGTSTIHSLVDNDSLNIASGSLTITSGASQVVGSLNVASGATLSLSGSGASFTASGATTIDGANLYAGGGATMTLSGATSYAAPGGATIQASGTGSLVDLSHLTTLAGGSYINILSVNALAGGEVDLSNLNNYTTGATGFYASGTGSTIDLSKLTGLLSDALYNSSLQASGGGTILDPLLATLNRTDVTTDGTGTLGTAQISTYTGGTIMANGSAPTTPA